jgi:ATP-dependent Clp protease ATP-binding subunit ClpC
MTENIPRLTPRMERAMTRAGQLARGRGHDYLGTEHMLLALLEDKFGVAGGVTHRLGCATAMRDEIIRIMESEGYAGRPTPTEPASSG